MSGTENVNSDKIVQELFNLKVPQSAGTKSAVMSNVKGLYKVQRLRKIKQFSIGAIVSATAVVTASIIYTAEASEIEKFAPEVELSEITHQKEVSIESTYLTEPPLNETAFFSGTHTKENEDEITSPTLSETNVLKGEYLNNQSTESVAAEPVFIESNNAEKHTESIKNENHAALNSNESKFSNNSSSEKIGSTSYTDNIFLSQNPVSLKGSSFFNNGNEINEIKLDYKWIDYENLTFNPNLIPIEKIQKKEPENYLYAMAGINAPFKKEFTTEFSNGSFKRGVNFEAGYGHKFSSGLNLELGLSQVSNSLDQRVYDEVMLSPGFWAYDYYFGSISTVDSDFNGLADGLDYDGDGYSDYEIVEGSEDTNGDGVPDYVVGLAIDGVITIPPPTSLDSVYFEPVIETITTAKSISVNKIGLPVRIGYCLDINPLFNINFQIGAGIYRQSITETVINSIFPEYVGLEISHKKFVINPEAQIQFNMKIKRFNTFLNFRGYQNYFSVSNGAEFKPIKFSVGLGLRYTF